MARREYTVADVDHALKVVAYVIRNHPLGRNALPVFERLELERERLAREADLMDRADTLSRALQLAEPA